MNTLILQYRPSRQCCRLDLVGIHQMIDLLTAGKQIIGNDTPMTAPPDGFRAHQHTALLATLLDKLIQSSLKICRECVISVILETLILPEIIGVT